PADLHPVLDGRRPQADGEQLFPRDVAMLPPDNQGNCSVKDIDHRWVWRIWSQYATFFATPSGAAGRVRFTPQCHEVVQSRWVRQGLPGGGLLRWGPHKDSLHGNLQDLPGQRPRDLVDLADLVRHVAGRAVLPNSAADLASQLIRQRRALAEDHEQGHPVA